MTDYGISARQGTPGWYPWPGGQDRYWDGKEWTETRPSPAGTGSVSGWPPVAYPEPTYGRIPPVLQPVPYSPRYVSGISNGERLLHILLTICTGGLWGLLIWWPAHYLRRKRVG